MMQDLKDALEYAVELSNPVTFEIGGETFSSQLLHRVEEKKDLLAAPLKISTLTGLIDFISENRDEICLSKTIIVISDEVNVSLLSVPNKDKNRETYVTASAVVPDHTFSRWMDFEDFVIGLQSKFADTEDKTNLMKYVGNM